MSDIVKSNQYKEITEKVSNHAEIVMRDSEIFQKSSSQFKTVALDVTDLTTSETAKHLLASILKTRAALEEASVAVRRKDVQIRRKEQELLVASGFDSEDLIIDIDELKSQLVRTEAAARGAIRKLAFLTTQYDRIVDVIGHQSEEEYEMDQARHHVMTAFMQALTAARSRGGIIDEGNHIYLFQLGINGAVAQAHVSSLLSQESALIADGQAPSHDMVVNWLNSLADQFAGCSLDYAQSRGLLPLDHSSMIEIGG
jgi:hypothetical protein